MTNLILCGGSGNRLWPLSQPEAPKQFLPLFHGKSLFETTIERNRGVAGSFWVASNRLHQDILRTQLEKSGIHEFGALLEPAGRNTAPAIALVCLSLPSDELVFATPSDHVVTKTTNYLLAVNRGKQLAREGNLVVFGLAPTSVETGYGYIEADGERVLSFHEKPNFQTAARYVESGRYLWNSGMCLFRAGDFLSELRRCSPEVYERVKIAYQKEGSIVAPNLELMEKIPSVSVDEAVFEKTTKAKVVPCDLGWSDLGSFEALLPHAAKRGENFCLSTGNTMAIEAKGNLIIGGSRPIGLIGIEGLIVVDRPEGLLILKSGSGQKVKDVVELLKAYPGL